MKIRDILGSFLFRGDEVDKKVKVLSGGERNRLALAKMLLSDFNVLVMDEPTNHLDIKSKNVLKKALQQFEGTLIIVSHDRDFLQGLTDKVYEFKNQHLKEYLGDIDFYLEQRAVANFREIEQPKETTTTAKAAQTPEKLSFEEQKQQKAAQNKLNKIERNITDLEQELKAMNEQMGQGLQTDAFYKQYEQKKQQLEDLMTEWESLMS
jgi:ABC transporter, ATP-binding protein